MEDKDVWLGGARALIDVVAVAATFIVVVVGWLVAASDTPVRPLQDGDEPYQKLHQPIKCWHRFSSFVASTISLLT